MLGPVSRFCGPANACPVVHPCAACSTSTRRRPFKVSKRAPANGRATYFSVWPHLQAACNESAGTSNEGEGSSQPSPSLNSPPSLDGLNIEQLRAALAFAVSTEDYRLASSIRDRMQQLSKVKRLTWASTGSLPDWLIDRVERLGYPWPSEVAQRSIPVLLTGRDAVIEVQPGAGQYLAYLLPTLAGLSYPPEVYSDDLKGPQCLILVHSQEVGVQVLQLVMKLFGHHVTAADAMHPRQYFGPKGVQVRGVLSQDDVMRAKGSRSLTYCHVVVATPACLEEVCAESLSLVQHLQAVVVDEADACWTQQTQALRSLLRHACSSGAGREEGKKPQVVYVSCRTCTGVTAEAVAEGWLTEPVLVGGCGGLEGLSKRSPLLASMSSQDDDEPLSSPSSSLSNALSASTVPNFHASLAAASSGDDSSSQPSSSSPSSNSGNGMSSSSSPLPSSSSSLLKSGADPFMRGLSDAVQRLRAYEQYKAQVSLPDEQIDVLQCSMLIAKHAYPHLSEQDCLDTLDDIADRVRAQLGSVRYPLRVVQVINEVLYHQMGFKGNQEDFYDPQNSLINRVLERRLGLPITLSLVYMEVARRVALPMVGLNLPSHFMIKPDLPDMEIIIDPFNNGEICYLQDAEDRLSAIMGMNVTLDANWVRSRHRFSARAFLLRLLNNLKNTYWNNGWPEECLHVVRYMRATDPSLVALIRDEGFCLYATKRYDECLAVLQDYLAQNPEAMDTMAVQAIMDKVKNKKTQKQREE